MWLFFILWCALGGRAAAQYEPPWPQSEGYDKINSTWMELYHAPLIKDRYATKFHSRPDLWTPKESIVIYDPAVAPLNVTAGLTPDYTAEEVPPTPLTQDYYGEFERPYKLQPFALSAAYWEQSYNNYWLAKAVCVQDHPQLLGCYCCTVFRRRVPLAGCAVLTTRHLLTTATSTELVLKDYPDRTSFEGLLGAWYDITYYGPNTSVYTTPARIHYHPQYLYPENVNASHPVPGLFDLAVWAATYPLHSVGTYQTYVCNRAGSYWLQFGSPTLGAVKQPVAIIVGFQFIKWFKRNPMPWYKYAVKTQKYSRKCPKTEWGWFFCIWGRWAMLGLDSGAALHRATQGQSWLYDGLLGLLAFSMDLRAKELTHYFTPVETHSVLTFLYDAYMSNIKYRFLDSRFENTRWHAPVPHKYERVVWSYKDSYPSAWDKYFQPPNFY